jgi:alpha-L-fucosidase
MKIRILLSLWLLTLSHGTVRAGSNTLNLPPISAGPYRADWNSLARYQTPEWFRDAKFGIWAHWGPQCEPEHGDWYARNMYLQGSGDYQSHLVEYGHPSTNGFKEVIHAWKAEQFDPDALLKFYKDNGAKYFLALAVHADNFDLWNSKHQPWNSVALGPKRDLIGGWAAAARKNGLRFGVSVHNGGWAWRWYEPSQGADTNGPFAGVPYDGRLTKAEGKGRWWEGLDPQQLYAQNHPVGARPDAAYCENFVRRTRQLIDDYRPDLVYFDEKGVPMGYLDADERYGLNLYAHFYNSNLRWHGRNEAVITAKLLTPLQRQAIVYDIERGKADRILPQPWQTDTCIGQWHYNAHILQHHYYKTAPSIIRMLCDIVSKNGNLMLSVPLQRGGQPDSDEIRIVGEIGAWLRVNGEAIYATRPWKIYGEGPSTAETDEAGEFDGEKDVSVKPYTSEDIRFTRSKDGKVLYALVMAVPTNGSVTIKSLAAHSQHWPADIGSVRLLGGGKLDFRRDEVGLHVSLPGRLLPAPAIALKIQR